MPLDPTLLEASSAGEAERSVPAFAVGDVVKVANRMEPGVNKPGGVAKITKVISSKGEDFFDVAYVVNNNHEYRLTASLLKSYIQPLSRPRRSLQASRTGKSRMF